jgi:ribonuclease HI
LKYALGRGSNNKAEYVALWVLIYLANWMGCQRLQVLGDSKLVIDWANNKIRVDNLELGPIKRACGELERTFEWISFAHTNHEMNVKEFYSQTWKSGTLSHCLLLFFALV